MHDLNIIRQLNEQAQAKWQRAVIDHFYLVESYYNPQAGQVIPQHYAAHVTLLRESTYHEVKFVGDNVRQIIQLVREHYYNVELAETARQQEFFLT